MPGALPGNLANATAWTACCHPSPCRRRALLTAPIDNLVQQGLRASVRE